MLTNPFRRPDFEALAEQIGEHARIHLNGDAVEWTWHSTAPAALKKQAHHWRRELRLYYLAVIAGRNSRVQG